MLTGVPRLPSSFSKLLACVFYCSQLFAVAEPSIAGLPRRFSPNGYGPFYHGLPLLAAMGHSKRLARALISQVGETEAVMSCEQLALFL